MDDPSVFSKPKCSRSKKKINENKKALLNTLNYKIWSWDISVRTVTDLREENPGFDSQGQTKPFRRKCPYLL
jgi:hypothetical protein